MDRDIYKSTMLKYLENDCENLAIHEGSVSNLLIEDGRCKGIIMKDGEIITSEAVILTTGTFLGAKVHIGLDSAEGGRYVRDPEGRDHTELEPPSNDLARSLHDLGFPVQRLRTGTPPRIQRDTIDYTGM